MPYFTINNQPFAFVTGISSFVLKVKLNIDWKKLGINPAKATITAPEITNFQPAQTFTANDEIPVTKGKGWLLIVK